MGKRFQHFFANNSQYIMIFFILQQCIAMWGYFGCTWWSPSKYWLWFLVVSAQLVNFILKCCCFLSLKSALIYFWATEYVFWSLSFTISMRLELLLIYYKVGPSKKEIIAKRSIFQRNIWTDLEKIFEPKSQKCKFGGSLISFNSENFVGDKRPLGETRKKFVPLVPP